MEFRVVAFEEKHLEGMVTIENKDISFTHDVEFGGGFQHNFQNLSAEELERVERLLVEVSEKFYIVKNILSK